jgi:hypothetical protein
MDQQDRGPVWPIILAIVLIYLVAAAIEPCDGHSCAGEVRDAR